MAYPETLAQVLAKLEPDSGFDGCAHVATFTPELRASISIAISLKRIADSFAPVDGSDIGTTLFYMEQRLGPQS